MKTFLFFAYFFCFSTLLFGAPEPTLDITHICNGGGATINYSYEGEDYYFGWHFEDGEPFLTEPGAGTIEDAPKGRHTVTLYVRGRGGYQSYSYIIDVYDITPTFNWVEGNACNGVSGDATAKITLHNYHSSINYTAYLKNPGGQVLLAANMTSSSHTFTNLPTGNYLVEVQSDDGACSHIKSIAIYDEYLTATVSADVGTCHTLGGSITIDLPDFQAGETYDISVENIDNFQVINYQQTTGNYTLANVAPGNYQITIRKGSCEKVLTVTVEGAGVQAITSLYLDGGCYWKFNAVMLGGAVATNYTWNLVDASGNLVTTGISYPTVEGDEIYIPTSHNSVAGTLTVTTVDGCTYTVNLEYPSTNMFLTSGTPSHTVTDNICGFSVGSIFVDWSMLSPNPTMAVHEVKLYNGPTYQTSLYPNGASEVTFTNLNAGTYKVELHARGNCNSEGIVDISNIIVAENARRLKTSNKIICDNGSLAELSVVASLAANISWGPTGGNPIPNATGGTYTVPSPLISSFYTVTVTENGCTSTEDFEIATMNFPGPEVIKPIRCGSPGTYQLWLPGITSSNPASPFAPYTVTIDGETTPAFGHGQASQPIAIETSGYYPVTITSVNTGCQMTINTYIGTAGLDVDFTEVNPSNCVTNNGSLSASTNSGVGPYTYTWSTGAQTQTITGLSLGATYTVTITDAANCTGTGSFTFNTAGAYGTLIVGEPNGPGSIWNNGPACSDNATLLASFDGASPPGPLTYTWSLSNAGNAALATGFGTGTHSVTVTDANGCTYTASKYLNAGWQYPSPQEVEQYIDCANNRFGFYFDYNAYWGCSSVDVEIYEHDASIDGSASGTDAFKTLIHTTTVQQNGSHTVWVPMNNALDPNTRIELRFGSCCNQWYWQPIHNLDFSLPEPTITILPASCTSSGDVQIDFPATSYTAPNQTVWHDGVISNHRTDLPAGTYMVNMQHQQGCSQQELVHIPGASGNPHLIQANSCQQSISLAANNITGGTANYTLKVNGVPTAVGTTLTGIGSYTLEITDANGCVGTEQLTIYEETYNATAQTTAPSCELTDGKIKLHVNNNVSGIASYEWTGPGASSYTGHTLNGLVAGNYTYTVTDNRGCQLSNSVTLPTNTTISLGLLGGCLPQVTNITGGTAPYQLAFEADLTQNPNPTQTSFNLILDGNTTYPYDLNALDQGAYNVYVTDKHGCQVGPYALNTLPTPAPTRNLSLLHMRWKRQEVTATTTNNYKEADVIKDDLAKQSQNFLDNLDALDGLADHCERQTTDQLDAQFEQSLHHYTLYYYNVKDQLVRTVPPAGVDFINNNTGTDLNDLLAFRQGTGPQPSKLIPDHHQVTQYDYNALGQMVKTNTPDKGIGTSLYTEDGLVRFVQDAKQAAAASPTYSYTLYDDLKRVIEVGEMSCATLLTQADVDALNLDQLPASSTKDEHVKTFYSIPHKIAGTPIAYYGLFNKQQRYLRNNVSYTESHQNGVVVTTSYSYDVHGKVEWIRQDIPGLGENYIAYDYDLLTKTVKQVRYNEYSEDRFFHKYTYDEQKRLKETYTSRDGIIWDKDANYDYYAHGSLKRTELGEDKIQGLDYIYTIHGWIKSVNNPLMDQYGLDPSDPNTNDVGKDGYENIFMKDVFGFTLGYYEGDFTRDGLDNLITYSSQQLYNGNVSSWSNGTNVEALAQSLPGFPSPNRESITQRDFTYDEVNRIKTSDFLVSNTPLGDENFPAMFVVPNKYSTSYSYDGNGNLQELSRYGDNNLIDALTYNYGANDLKNRLNSVEDGQGNQGVGDLEALQSYLYDEIGNLTRSTTPIAASGTTEIMNVYWRVDGKVDYVTVANGGNTSQLNFLYDATGNRVAKVWDPNIANPNDEITTYHVRDASGNILATYDKTYNGTAFEKSLKERALFGSQRLGIDKKSITFIGTQDIVRSGVSILEGLQIRTVSDKLFELSDHLGNVTTTVSDYKLKTGTGYEANLLSYQQYYPFGWTMPERQANVGNYRFSFNGMEKDDEVGNGNFTTMFRAYDARVARWWSVDPLSYKQAWISPYVAFDNSPIWKTDTDGDLPIIIVWALKKLGEAALDVVVDVAIQAAIEHYIGGVNWGDVDIDWGSALFAGGESFISNKKAKIIASAGYEMLSYTYNAEDWNVEDFVKTGIYGGLSSLIGDRVGGLVTKYGLPSVVNGLEKMGVKRQQINRWLGLNGCFLAGTPIIGIDSTINIENIELGQLVTVSLDHSENPIGYNASHNQVLNRELITSTSWKKLYIELLKPNNTITKIELLRPDWWIEKNVDKSNNKVYITIPELKLSGYANVINISEHTIQLTPEYFKYRAVTGKFTHISDMVIQLNFKNTNTLLSVTSNHPIWSESQNKWVDAGKLKIGEKVFTNNGSTTLIRKTVLEGIHEVYNLEVHDAHNYFVSDIGILVHNAVSCPIITEGLDNLKTTTASKSNNWTLDVEGKWQNKKSGSSNYAPHKINESDADQIGAEFLGHSLDEATKVYKKNGQLLGYVSKDGTRRYRVPSTHEGTRKINLEIDTKGSNRWDELDKRGAIKNENANHHIEIITD